MRRHILLAVAVLASVVAFSPLVLVGRFGSWWYLIGCLVTVPISEATWWAHDRADRRADGRRCGPPS